MKFDKEEEIFYMKISRNPAFFPILINLQNFPCLVIGGGKVALRKVLSLLDFNATVTLLSPRISKQLLNLSKEKKIRIIKKSYSKEFIKEFKIVFCTTDNVKLNKVVQKDCKEENILINVADDPLLCGFILPANVKRGNLTISVSTQGTAPFFAKEIRKKIELLMPPVYKDITDLASTYREQMLNNNKFKMPKIKTKMLERFLEMDWEKILIEEGKVNSRRYMQKIQNEFN